MDPSLSNWAFAAARMNPVTHELTMRTVMLAQTAKSSAKGVMTCTDDLARAQILSDKVFAYTGFAHAIFVEVPTGSQGSRGAVGNGVCYGILASLRSNKIPFFEVTPHQLKMATIGKSTASKDDIIDWAMATYPDLDRPMKTIRGETTYIKAKCNHMADAIGAIHAGVQTQQFQQLMALRR